MRPPFVVSHIVTEPTDGVILAVVVDIADVVVTPSPTRFHDPAGSAAW
jgi:hypothetical protein